jgi:plastocyanin
MRGARIVVAGIVLASTMVGGCGAPAANEAPPSVVAGQLVVVARDIAFTPAEVTMTSDTALTVVLDNQDAGVPHNVALLGGPGEGTKLAKTEIVSGVAQARFSIPPLIPGGYRLICEVHPTMTANLRVVAGS